MRNIKKRLMILASIKNMQRLFFLSCTVLAIIVFMSFGSADAGENEASFTLGGSAGHWWKGNLHTHSLWSDGDHYPEMIVDWYKKRGYHFLTLSDHNRLSRGDRWLCEDKWLDPNDKRKRVGEKSLSEYIDKFGTDWVQQREVDGKGWIRLKPLNEFRCMFEEPQRFLLIEGEEITDALRTHLGGVNLAELIPPQGGKNPTELMQNDINAVLAQEKKNGSEYVGSYQSSQFLLVANS